MNNATLSNTLSQESSVEEINSRENDNKNRFSGKCTHPYFSSENNFFNESFFQEMLLLERKRSERSNKQFLLILIDIEKLISKERSNSTVDKFIRIVNWISRDTDIKGWYEENRVIGIIYTGITYMSVESIIEKVEIEINNTFNSEQTASIDMSHFLFPKKNNKINHDISHNNTTSCLITKGAY